MSRVFLSGAYGVYNPEKYLDFVRSAANKGNKQAQDEIKGGWHYAYVANGYLLGERDFDRAHYWAKKARDESMGYNAIRAFAEDCWTEAELGRSIGAGDGFRYASLGGESGNPYCVAEMGMCYWKGVGVKKDIYKAKALLETARRMDGYDPSFNRKYEETYQLAEKAIGDEYEAIRRKQMMAENAYRNSYSTSSSFSASTSSTSSSTSSYYSYSSYSDWDLGPIIAFGAIIAGIAAICDAIDTPSKPSTSSSSSSSSSLRSSSSSSSNSYSSSSSSSYRSSSSGSISLCPECSGRGMRICVWCKGSGKGSGVYRNETCAWCDGRGQYYCTHCSGRGSIRN